jgi:hypothetical protein
MKAATKKKRNLDGEVGDTWTWLAIDVDSKDSHACDGGGTG